jgi:hypothetical protein
MAKKKQNSSIAERLRELKHAVPFSPFRVTTAAGDTLTVTTADDFIVSPKGGTGFFNAQETETTTYLDLRDVRSINLIDHERSIEKGRRSNGRGKQ